MNSKRTARPGPRPQDWQAAFGCLAFWASLSLLGCGLLLRLAVFLQNRNLFIDEANIARNLFERGYAGLLKPLAYEQAAPPVFLWALKFAAGLFGYSEFALRLYPFLAGIAAVGLFALVVKETVPVRAAWYPIGLFSLAPILVRYSSEAKQYMPDLAIALGLVLLALRANPNLLGRRRFLAVWAVAGSVALWASMPAVFVLCGVIACYAASGIRRRTVRPLADVLALGAVWAAQFAIYYAVLLRGEVDSPEMHGYHGAYFLAVLPVGREALHHNLDVLRENLGAIGGYWPVAVGLNAVLLAAGAWRLLRFQTDKALLVLVPVAATLTAAALQRYSLAPRLALFLLPLLLVGIGQGVDALLSLRYRILRLVPVLLLIRCISSHSGMGMILNPYKKEAMTDVLAFLQASDVQGRDVSVIGNAWPSYYYYTQIHPGKDAWRNVAGGRKVGAAADLAPGFLASGRRSAFVHLDLSRAEEEQRRRRLRAGMEEVAHLEAPDGFGRAYVYEPARERRPSQSDDGSDLQ